MQSGLATKIQQVRETVSTFLVHASWGLQRLLCVLYWSVSDCQKNFNIVIIDDSLRFFCVLWESRSTGTVGLYIRVLCFQNDEFWHPPPLLKDLYSPFFCTSLMSLEDWNGFVEASMSHTPRTVIWTGAPCGCAGNFVKICNGSYHTS